MKSIYDVKGYCDFTGEYKFYGEESWEGKIILHDDGWFEGIVQGNNSLNNDNSLIFGIYFPNKVIKLFKLAPRRVCEPIAIDAMKEEIGYDGPMTILKMSEKLPSGVSKLITRKNKKEDIEEIQKNIQTFIETEECKDLYQVYRLMSKQVSETLLRQYKSARRQYKKAKTS